MNFFKYSIFIIAITVLSCKKELIDLVNFKKPVLQYDLVVEGGVNTFTEKQFIRLTRPSYNITGNVSAVNDAEVFINNIKLTLTATPGIYSGAMQENKNYEKPYYLKIIYKGNIYQAKDTLKKTLPITLADLNITSQQQNDNILLSVPQHTFSSSLPVRLFFHFPGKSDWRPSKLDSVQAYSYAHVFAPPNGLYPVLEERINVILNPADSVKVYKFSVSDSHEKYLFNLFQETDWKGIFSSNPGPVKGNISGNALGFFYCTDVVFKKFAARDLEK